MGEMGDTRREDAHYSEREGLYVGRIAMFIDNSERYARKLARKSERVVRKLLRREEPFARRVVRRGEQVAEDLLEVPQHYARKIAQGGERIAEELVEIPQRAANKVAEEYERVAHEMLKKQRRAARNLEKKSERTARKLAKESERVAHELKETREQFARKLADEGERIARKLTGRPEPQPPQPPVALIVLAALGSILASLIGGLVLYSRLFVPRKLALLPAIPARQAHAMMPTTGMVNYYADTSALGRPLVLVHSINAGASAHEMRPLFEMFRGTRPVYALDLPGFGFSERSNRHYSPELYARAISEFLEREVGERADVIALSLSGEFASMAALQRPDLFETLTLISPTGLMGEKKAAQSTRAKGKSDLAHALLSFPLWSQALYDLLTTRKSIGSFLKMSFVGDPPAEMIEYDYATTHQPGARYAPLSFVSGKLFTPDIREAVYERLELPVLVIYDHDPYVDFDMLPNLVDNLPNWNMARIEPTRGLPHWEMPQATVLALEAFWNILSPSNSR
jgi:pimeloyl-ACP methyl ester carboxylesterase